MALNVPTPITPKQDALLPEDLTTARFEQEILARIEEENVLKAEQARTEAGNNTAMTDNGFSNISRASFSAALASKEASANGDDEESSSEGKRSDYYLDNAVREAIDRAREFSSRLQLSIQRSLNRFTREQEALQQEIENYNRDQQALEAQTALLQESVAEETAVLEEKATEAEIASAEADAAIAAELACKEETSCAPGTLAVLEARTDEALAKEESAQESVIETQESLNTAKAQIAQNRETIGQIVEARVETQEDLAVVEQNKSRAQEHERQRQEIDRLLKNGDISAEEATRRQRVLEREGGYNDGTTDALPSNALTRGSAANNDGTGIDAPSIQGRFMDAASGRPFEQPAADPAAPGNERRLTNAGPAPG